MIRQRWRDLLFVHWAMPVDAVRPVVPAPYPLRAASLGDLSESLLAAAGLRAPGAPLCHHSPGVDVEILGLRPVLPGLPGA